MSWLMSMYIRGAEKLFVWLAPESIDDPWDIYLYEDEDEDL